MIERGVLDEFRKELVIELEKALNRIDHLEEKVKTLELQSKPNTPIWRRNPINWG